MITSAHFTQQADKTANVNNVVSFKMTNGIEFIAKFESAVDDHTVQLSKSRLLNISYDNRGSINASLIPFSNSNPDASITLSTSDILAVYTPSNDVEQDYIQSTTPIDLLGA